MSLDEARDVLSEVEGRRHEGFATKGTKITKDSRFSCASFRRKETPEQGGLRGGTNCGCERVPPTHSPCGGPDQAARAPRSRDESNRRRRLARAASDRHSAPT